MNEESKKMYERNIEEIPFVIREYYGIIAESLILKPFNSREIKYKREFESIRLAGKGKIYYSLTRQKKDKLSKNIALQMKIQQETYIKKMICQKNQEIQFIWNIYEEFVEFRDVIKKE